MNIHEWITNGPGTRYGLNQWLPNGGSQRVRREDPKPWENIVLANLLSIRVFILSIYYILCSEIIVLRAVWLINIAKYIFLFSTQNFAAGINYKWSS